MVHFRAAEAACFDDPELGVAGVVLSDGSGRSLEVQRSHEITAQDRELGMDTYCVVIDGGTTHYGGVQHWSVSPAGTVRLEFDEVAAEAFETHAIEVTVEVEQAGKVRSSLRRLVE